MHGCIGLHVLYAGHVVGVTLEAQQPAERLLGDDLLDHRHVVAGHLDRVDAEGRLLVVLADAVQQLVAGGDARRARYGRQPAVRSEEHTSELLSLMRISYAVFCLKKKKNRTTK